MMGPGGNPYAGNRHADVLSEEPKDDAAKIKLVEEVKNRAKGAFQQKDMPSAELLYGKAISVLDTMPGKAEAVLYSNRSMVRLNLNKVEGALEDANKCIKLDPTMAKAFHRKAQALTRLSEWDDAIAAAEEGAKLDPNNKAFAEMIEKAKQDKEKDVEDKAKLKRDAQDVRVELHNASTARSAQPKKPEAQNGEEDTSMRGYKTRADGKKTSYFHTDITDEAKRLIEAQGFGKPQKLDQPAETAEVKGGGSQWNQAGTYEEKGMMGWVEGGLKRALENLVFETDNTKIKSTKVANIKGDASISCSRGKRRHLLDISFDVEFEGKIDDTTGGGKIVYTEVSSGDDDPEITVEVSSETPPAMRKVFDSFVKPAGQGLQPLVSAALKKVVEEYKVQ